MNIIELLCRMFSESQPGHGANSLGSIGSLWGRMARSWLQRDRTRKIIGLVVLVERLVPAIVVRDARHFVEIRELVVSKPARRRGVGQSLIDAAKTWARERNIRNLEVSAWSFNVETIEFYRKVGFQRTIEWFAMSSI